MQRVYCTAEKGARYGRDGFWHRHQEDQHEPAEADVHRATSAQYDERTLDDRDRADWDWLVPDGAAAAASGARRKRAADAAANDALNTNGHRFLFKGKIGGRSVSHRGRSRRGWYMKLAN